MRFLPEASIIQNEKFFAGILTGEAVLLLAGSWAAFRYGNSSIFLVGWMCGAIVARAFLIWAWGQRYPQTNFFYLLWTVPGFVRDALLGFGFMTFWISKGISIHGGKVMTGDSSITTWGVALLAIGLLVRGMGLGWVVLHRKREGIREGISWPAFVLATITFFALFSIAHGVLQGGIRGLLMAAFFFIPQYGFQVYL